MKGKSLIAAVFIVCAALLSFVTWQTGLAKQADIDHLGFFKTFEDQLVIQYGQRLWWLSPDEQVQRRLEISDLGLTAQGDYDFFANGDLLIYHRSTPLTHLDKLKQWLRLSETIPLNRASGERGVEGFYRCQLSHLQCQPFGQGLAPLKRSFRVLIDRQDDSVYLSVTSAHRLYKISAQGKILASSGDNQFRFPNQLSLHDGLLWVADTNHQRMVGVTHGDAQFAQEVTALTTSPSKEHRFAHQFSWVGDRLWVNVADGSMSNGMILEYDAQGESYHQLQNVHVSDPMAMIYWQDTLWVADFVSAFIEQFNTQGESLGVLMQAEMLPYINQREQQITQGKQLASLGIFMFIMTLLIGLAAAWYLEKRQSLALFADPIDDEIACAKAEFNANSARDSGIFWLENRIVEYKKWYQVVMVLLVIPIAMLLNIYIKHPMLVDVLCWSAVIYGAWVWGAWSLLAYVMANKVGVQGQYLIYEVKGELNRIPFEQVSYHGAFLFTPQKAIFLGRSKPDIFAKSELKQYIYPQLLVQNRLSKLQYYQRLWQLKDRLFINIILLIVCLLGLSLFRLFGQ